MHQSILSYRGSRYLWWCLLLSVGAIIAYIVDEPTMPPNGGTILGYILGTISAVLVIWLMWFGIRKRRYKSNVGTVAGWLSAHVYLGLALIIVATLHTGFQFGLNVHTLVYVLMIFVIISGIFGVYFYMYFPRLMTDNRSGDSTDSLLRQIQEIDRKALLIASEINDETHEKVLNSIRRSRIGGSVLTILLGRHKVSSFEGVAQEEKVDQKEVKKQEVDSDAAFMTFIARDIAHGREDTSDLLRQLSDLLFGQKEKLLSQLRRDIQYKAYMDLWLYIHVPFSFALLAALIVHTVSVFFYW